MAADFELKKANNAYLIITYMERAIIQMNCKLPINNLN
jgi:hypothetical protein